MKNRTRMCMSCRRKTQKEELLRLVKVGTGFIFDETKKAQGRGGWVCKNKECLQKLNKKCKISYAGIGEIEGGVTFEQDESV